MRISQESDLRWGMRPGGTFEIVDFVDLKPFCSCHDVFHHHKALKLLAVVDPAG
jgi:hypothetical protein